MAASTNDMFKKVGDATVTTLAAPGKAIGATSITVGSTTNYPTDTGVIIAIRVVDTSGELVAGTYTEFSGTITSSTTVGIVATPVYGSDQVYPAGSTTQVYIGLSKYGYNTLVDGILVNHSQTGTHEIDQNYDPSNPTLETQKWVGVASAVNEVTVTNASTGTSPSVSATGGDTNISLTLSPKGSGEVLIDGTYARLGARRTYTANDTWTKPSNLKFIIVEVRGGGGGGGGGGTTSGTAAAGGGGQGGYSVDKVAAASLASTEAVTVGGGGAGGAATGATGTTGTTSSFGALCTALGGLGGVGTGATGTIGTLAGGLGGAGGTGDFTLRGAVGANSGTDNTNYLSGGGGGDGGGGTRGSAGTGLAAAANTGGGGGGMVKSGVTGQVGGAGGSGYVIVSEYF